MTNILLVAVILSNLAVFTLILLVALRVKREIKAFLTPISANEPSPLATMVDGIAIVFGRALITQVKAGMMGALSGATRAETANQVNNNPILGLASFFLGKKAAGNLARNPAILDFVMSKMKGFNGSNPLGGAIPNAQGQPGNGKVEDQTSMNLGV